MRFSARSAAGASVARAEVSLAGCAEEDPRGATAWAARLPEATRAEQGIVEAQLERPARGSVAIAARCRYGLPTVVRSAPRLGDGSPFPTLYWLTCPAARTAIGRLEAQGWNKQLTHQISSEPQLAQTYADAHQSYVSQRDALGRLPWSPGAGGMPGRVKCLHVLYAHELATGVNPIGSLVRSVVEPLPCAGPCVDAPAPPGCDSARRTGRSQR